MDPRAVGCVLGLVGEGCRAIGRAPKEGPCVGGRGAAPERERGPGLAAKGGSWAERGMSAWAGAKGRSWGQGRKNGPGLVGTDGGTTRGNKEDGH